MGNLWGKLTSGSGQKVLGVLAIIFLLLAIPLTVWLGKQAQPQPKAANNGSVQTRYCNGKATLTLTQVEAPDCTPQGGAPFGIVNGIPSFQVTTTISGGPPGGTLQWAWGTYFCAVEDPHASCHSGTVNPGSTKFDGSGNAVAAAPPMSPTAGFKACGYYQYDLAIKVFDASGNFLCSYGDLSQPDVSNTVYAWCHSGVPCTASTPTPTPTTPVTNTPTPTTRITSTPTPTVTPTITVTPTLTLTPTPTSTASPTPTTPITGTITPTTAISSTPTPTTPIVITNSPTPRPTLPPTGPGNTILTIGGLGGILTVLGALLLLGL